MQTLLNSLETSLRSRYGLPVSIKARRMAPLGSFDRLRSFPSMTAQLLVANRSSAVELI